MKQLLRSRFLPPDYDQVLFQQYQNCRQGNRLVRDYAAEFYRLSARNDLSETEAQQVARFIGGLKPIIHDRVVLQPVYFLNDAVQLATKVEAQLERSNTRHPFSGKGILPTPDQIPPGRVAPRIDNLPTMASQDCESSKAKTSRFSNAKGAAVNPYAPPPPIKCYRCSQPGHRSNQCPSRQVNLATHGEENTVLQDENDVEDETEVTYEDEGISLVLCRPPVLLRPCPDARAQPAHHRLRSTQLHPQAAPSPYPSSNPGRASLCSRRRRSIFPATQADADDSIALSLVPSPSKPPSPCTSLAAR
ncbi:hypothetical protein M0R45_006031 [Rubus argutus]|uniref:CCHC-type domain-containing protein n=1 Tax=Rubus argutus TaxID=59490 RepID=A0AAW1YPY3_RUBAR